LDSADYKKSWQLHVRVARGEQLSPDERVDYESALRNLDAGESLGALAEARQARYDMRSLEVEHSRLENRRRELEQEISNLESKLGEPTRQLLTAED
jgi:hypothetical protein